MATKTETKTEKKSQYRGLMANWKCCPKHPCPADNRHKPHNGECCAHQGSDKGA